MRIQLRGQMKQNLSGKVRPRSGGRARAVLSRSALFTSKGSRNLGEPMPLAEVRRVVYGPPIGNCRSTKWTVEKAIAESHADLVFFGRSFISNVNSPIQNRLAGGRTRAWLVSRRCSRYDIGDRGDGLA